MADHPPTRSPPPPPRLLASSCLPGLSSRRSASRRSHHSKGGIRSTQSSLIWDEPGSVSAMHLSALSVMALRCCQRPSWSASRMPSKPSGVPRDTATCICGQTCYSTGVSCALAADEATAFSISAVPQPARGRVASSCSGVRRRLCCTGVTGIPRGTGRRSSIPITQGSDCRFGPGNTFPWPSPRWLDPGSSGACLS
jgi:hypothetical protein